MGLDKKKDEVKGEFIRIQKYISDCGIMSRRAAEHEIRLGNVKINGVCAEIGGKVDPLSDIITVRGERIKGKERNYNTFGRIWPQVRGRSCFGLRRKAKSGWEA